MKFFETIIACCIGLIWLIFNEPMSFLMLISVPIGLIAFGVILGQIF